MKMNKKLLCPCQSNRYYNECCELKPKYVFEYHTFQEFVSKRLKQISHYQLPCAYDKNCKNKTIKSHTLQNNGVLSKIAVDNHLFTISMSKKTDMPVLSVNTLGKGNTSVFYCLCHKHDSEIFAPIEKQKFVANGEQMLLFSFRAVLYSYWKSAIINLLWETEYISKYNIFYETINKKSKDKLYIGFVESYISAQKDHERISDLYNKYLSAYKTKDFDLLVHKHYELDYEIAFACSFVGYIPTIPESGEFSPMFDIETRLKFNYPILTVTCFPNNGKAHLIFSWVNEKTENEYYSKFFSTLSTQEIIRILNVAIPMSSEDVYYSPLLINSFSNEEKEFLCLIANPIVRLAIQEKQQDEYLELLSKWNNFTYDIFKKL